MDVPQRLYLACHSASLTGFLAIQRVSVKACSDSAEGHLHHLRGDSPWHAAILRRVTRMRRDNELPQPEVPPGASASEKAAMLAVAASHPLWMVERWLRRYGEADTLKLLVANNRCLACLHRRCLLKQVSAMHILALRCEQR